MRFVVLSDIHGNLPALEALRCELLESVLVCGLTHRPWWIERHCKLARAFMLSNETGVDVGRLFLEDVFQLADGAGMWAGPRGGRD